MMVAVKMEPAFLMGHDQIAVFYVLRVYRECLADIAAQIVDFTMERAVIPFKGRAFEHYGATGAAAPAFAFADGQGHSGFIGP